MADQCPSPGCAEKAAEKAADAAVKKVFAMFGYDIDEPKDVKKFQRVIEFAEDAKDWTDKSKMTFWLAILALLAGIAVKKFIF